MKKYNVILCGLLSCFFMLTGCEKDLMDYEGKDCIYFDVRRGAEHIQENLWSHEYYTAISFGNIIGDEVDLDLKVMATGTMKDYDRSFQVAICNDSTTATNGSDFEGLQDTYTIKAGETHTSVKLKVKRTEAMNGDTLKLQLQLKPNEHFDLAYQEYKDYPGTYDPSYSPGYNPDFAQNKDAGIHNMYFYDVLSRPATWMGNDETGFGIFGKFSAKKFRLIMEISGTTVNDFLSSETMPRVRVTAISEMVSAYLLEQAKKKEPVIDEDGTMMWLMYVQTLGGSEAWAPFTKPEDYYK